MTGVFDVDLEEVIARNLTWSNTAQHMLGRVHWDLGICSPHAACFDDLSTCSRVAQKLFATTLLPIRSSSWELVLFCCIITDLFKRQGNLPVQ